MSKSFELMLIFHKGTGKAESEKIMDRIKKTLKDGKNSSSEDLGIKHLSYPIKKETEGNYWLLKFKGESREIGEIGKMLKMEPKVLRHLLTKSPLVKEK